MGFLPGNTCFGGLSPLFCAWGTPAVECWRDRTCFGRPRMSLDSCMAPHIKMALCQFLPGAKLDKYVRLPSFFKIYQWASISQIVSALAGWIYSLTPDAPCCIGLRKGCERVDVGYVWEVSWRRNRLPHIDLKFLWLLQHFFLILLGCSTGVLRAQAHCLELVLTPRATATGTELQLELQLKLSVAPCYIIVWHPSASCGRRICTEFNPSAGQGDIPISSTRCTCFLIGGSVEGQYSPVWRIPKRPSIFFHPHPWVWPNRLGLQNTPTASLQRSKTPTTRVTRNNLMVRL